MQIGKDLALIQHSITKSAPAPSKPPAVNHIMVVDTSGSMWGEITKIRDDIKKKLPTLLSDGDTFTAVWFSGRGEYGVIVEGEPIATMKDLKNVYAALDRELHGRGLTGFKGPLEEVGNIIGRLKKKNSNGFSLFFLSDGAENCSPRSEVLKALEAVAKDLSSATICEFGFYADRNFLSQMAERAGGALIFADRFEKYSPLFESAMKKEGMGTPRVEVKIPDAPIEGFVFTLEGKEIVTYAVEDGKVSIPATTSEVFYLAKNDLDDNSKELWSDHQVSALYGAMTLFAQRMKSDIVFPILRKLGDVRFIESYASCFGKQRYSDFVEAAKEAAFDPAKRLTQGFDPNKVPADDAFTVLELLEKLADRNASALLDHPDFKYSRIGRGRIDSVSVLTPEEAAEVASLTAEMAKTKNAKKVQELSARVASITGTKQAPLEFVETSPEEGNPISNLTYNEDRPNISMLVTKTGTVDLSDRLPEEFKGTTVGKIPVQFPTKIFRNYTVIKDGLINVEVLPVRIDDLSDFPPESFEKREQNIVLFKLREIPVINRKMVKAVDAKSFFQLNWQLMQVKAAQKAFNSLQKEHFPEKGGTDTYAALYGEAGAAWLKEQGITEGGFSPKSVLAESVDFYLAKQLKVSFKGYSTLPSLKDARAKIASGKPNGPTLLMKTAMDAVAERIAKNGGPTEGVKTWLLAAQEATTKEARRLMLEIAKVKYAIVVGQVWPFPSLDETSLEMDFDGVKVLASMEMSDKEEKI